MDILNFLFPAPTLDIFIKLLIAMALGMVIGIERVFAHKTAGMRTHALVSMGAALFVIIGEVISAKYLMSFGVDPDPLKMAASIVTGIGFLGAGLIILKENQLMGLTTASGLWVSAGIGIAAGFGLYSLAILATVMTLIIFTVLWYVELMIKENLSDKK